MHKKETLESLDYFVENGKALYEYTYEEKPEIENQNRLVLKEREYFGQLPSWAQDYFLRNVVHKELKERVRWLSDAVSSECTFNIKDSIKKKKTLITSLNNEFLRIEKAGNNQLHLRQEYAKYLADPKTTKCPVKYICQNCKSLDTRIKGKEPYTATETYVVSSYTTYETKFLYSDRGTNYYQEVAKENPTYGTREVTLYRTIYKCSVCKKKDFKDSAGRSLSKYETPLTKAINSIKLILAFLAFLVFLFSLGSW